MAAGGMAREPNSSVFTEFDQAAEGVALAAKRAEELVDRLVGQAPPSAERAPSPAGTVEGLVGQGFAATERVRAAVGRLATALDRLEKALP